MHYLKGGGLARRSDDFVVGQGRLLMAWAYRTFARADGCDEILVWDSP